MSLSFSRPEPTTNWIVQQLKGKPNGTAALMKMLTYVRPEGSEGQRDFIKRWLAPLGLKRDSVGNYWKYVGDNPRVLWSCHTDTVHKEKRYARQTVRITKRGIIYRSDGKDVLGADDGAGCWLARELILAGKPGLYVFHTGEEIGGVGSRHIAKNRSEVLGRIDFAIALDRAGYSDVITHQGGSRCCSDDFAESLAEQLNAMTGQSFAPCDGGTFTDTANYVDAIGECTNLSVGYSGAHSNKESVDARFLESLLDGLKQLDIDKLEMKRKPGEHEELWDDWRDSRIDSWNRHYNWRDDDAYDPNKLFADEKHTLSDSARLLNIVMNYPEEVAAYLEEYGIGADELAQYIK